MSKKKKNNKKNKIKILSSYKRGLKIACINPRGLVSSPVKRIDLFNWIKLNDLDIICIQEWYVPKKKVVFNNQDVKNDENDNKNFNLASLKIEFDMSIFIGYKKIEHDNKTLILYKESLKVIRFNHFRKISENGLDISWIGIVTNSVRNFPLTPTLSSKNSAAQVNISSFSAVSPPLVRRLLQKTQWRSRKNKRRSGAASGAVRTLVTNRKILIVGSLYYSPSFTCQFDQIEQQKRMIRKELAHHKKQLIFMINGDVNAKHTIWGSTIIDQRGEDLLDWMGNNKMTF